VNTDTITKLTYPTITERGTARPNYGASPTEVTIYNCDVQPGLSSELVALQRQGSEVRYTVYAPADAPLDEKSIVRCRGQICQVDGEPQVWGPPLAHKLVLLTAWEQ
jgi:hypothetical protein